MSSSWINNGNGVGICCDADADNNLLTVKLKKPSAWQWELTTSRSAPNIALPKILLFNHKGELLADASDPVDGAIYRSDNGVHKPSILKARRVFQDDEDTGLGSLDSAERHAAQRRAKGRLSTCQQSFQQRDSSCESNSQVRENNSWRNSVPDELDFSVLQIYEDASTTCSSSLSRIHEEVPLNTSLRSSEFCRSPVRARQRERSSANSETGTSKERRGRRSNASDRSGIINCNSILERQSLLKGHSTSPESDHVRNHQDNAELKYILRSCRAGTLVIAKESTNHNRVRRRRRKLSSSEMNGRQSNTASEKNESFH